MPEQQVVLETPIASTWRSQEKWSKAADGFKQSYQRWKLVALVLSCAGAVLAVASDQMATQWGPWAKAAHGWVAGLGALALVLVPVVTQLGTSRSALERWLRARSVSEQLKTEIFQYLTRTGPYVESPADAELIKRRDLLLNKDLRAKRRVDGRMAQDSEAGRQESPAGNNAPIV